MSRPIFNAKILLNNSQPDMNPDEYILSFSLTDALGLFSTADIQPEDLVFLDVSGITPGAISRYKVLNVIMQDGVDADVLVKYVDNDDFPPVDPSVSIGLEGLIARPNPSGLFSFADFGLQVLPSNFLTAPLNATITQKLDKRLASFASVVTSGGVEMLTADSERFRVYSGVNFQQVNLPDTQTLNLGDAFFIENVALVPLAVSNFLGSPLQTINPGERAEFRVSNVMMNLWFVTLLNGAVAGGDFADRSLSNLQSPTSVNESLLPQGGQSLGSGGARWASVFGNAFFTRTLSLQSQANATVEFKNAYKGSAAASTSTPIVTLGGAFVSAYEITALLYDSLGAKLDQIIVVALPTGLTSIPKESTPIGTAVEAEIVVVNTAGSIAISINNQEASPIMYGIVIKQII